MKINVKINTKNASKIKNCKAFVSLNIDDVFAISGIKLMEGSNGAWLSFPSYKMGNDYKDYVYPLTSNYRKALTEKVLKAYNETVNEDEEIPFE